MRTPWYMTLLILVLMAPALGFPWLLANAGPDSTVQTLIWLYPAYVIVAGLCAWLTYPRRREVSWILIFLLALSQAGVYYLALGPA